MPHTSNTIVGTEGDELKNKVIIHCITSSISCFLAPQISRKLMRHGAKVIPVMSPEAAKFINPMIFEWATGELPITEIKGKVEHVKYAGLSEEKADLILVAPITANSISKIANGIMDTPVTLMTGAALGNKIPVIMVPTMHEVMMHNPAIEENIDKLKKMGVSFVYPRVEEEKAKIPENDEIVEMCIRKIYNNSLKGKKVLINAGPTRAYLDGIRFLTNPSSGKMGYALALESWRRGAEVKLVYGATLLSPPKVIENTIKVETADEMYNEMLDALKQNQFDYVILAAAMNDFEAEEVRDSKIPSSSYLELKLKPTKKLADAVKETSPISQLILFKAEYKKSTEDLKEVAVKRMQDANADLIVANDVSERKFGFESDNNKVLIIPFEGEMIEEEGSKLQIAKRILDTIEKMS
ncbi:MAG: bifunctional phosphopantothenoylcysteine decarboxylase/phosphopantothenate--cysteine ligase CoaBC [Candidatus Heimdallarchaeota archaeon]|nr:bifunctional phosphopantothenoylcysteine decarboxylase/phosphopantothenate--cysteine ligase CoaBC [Candidatus Heimdallarchaeota archaeon]